MDQISKYNILNKEFLFIINPIAGVKSKSQLESTIKQICHEAQKDFEIHYTAYAGHLPILIKELVKKGNKKIIVAGGDGTINEAGSALLYTDVALGIIPLGSGNGLARHLKIPLNAQQAIQKIIHSHQTLTIDAGRVNNHYFFSNAGIGFDADVIKHYENTPSRGLKTYLQSTLKSFMNFKRFEFRFNDDEVILKTFLINVANASQYGYGFEIAPIASLQDGELDLVAGTMKHKLDLLRFGVELLFKVKKPTPVTIRKTIKEITLHFEEKIPLQLDGELKDTITSAHFEIVPKALKIML